MKNVDYPRCSVKIKSYTIASSLIMYLVTLCEVPMQLPTVWLVFISFWEYKKHKE